MSETVFILLRRLAGRLAVLLTFLVVLGDSSLAEDGKPWVRERKNIRILMRDGKWLAADVHFPPEEGKDPTVQIQTPYNKDYSRPTPSQRATR